MKVRARKAELGHIDGTNWPKLQETSSIHCWINYKPMPKPKFHFRMKRQDLELYNICFLPGRQSSGRMVDLVSEPFLPRVR